MQRHTFLSSHTGPIALVCLRYENVNEPYLGRVWYLYLFAQPG